MHMYLGVLRDWCLKFRFGHLRGHDGCRLLVFTWETTLFVQKSFKSSFKMPQQNRDNFIGIRHFVGDIDVHLLEESEFFHSFSSLCFWFYFHKLKIAVISNVQLERSTENAFTECLGARHVLPYAAKACIWVLIIMRFRFNHKGETGLD